MAYDVRSSVFAHHSLATINLRIVTVGFFDDIYVPLVFLPEPSAL